jgi:hypothetical protein
MFTITINVPDDVLAAGGGSLQAAMYGQLLASYTPASGPSKDQPLASNTWVYFTGADYAAVTSQVPAFATYTSAGAQPVNLPAVEIQAAHIVFGVGSLPTISVDTTNAPQQPSPMSTDSMYDLVEFTYNADGALYLNTTMIDQFGIPIQIQIDPAAPVLPEGAGVTLDRADVFTQYRNYVKDAYPDFMQCATDAFNNSLTDRILSPKYAITGNCVQGVVANAFSGPPSSLPAGLYYYAVSALDGNNTESYAQYEVVQANVGAGQAVTVAWAPNANQPAGRASYNLYRGTPSGESVSWGLVGNVLASQFTVGVGGAMTDTGAALASGTPTMNPLVTFFDSEIQKFFANYQGGNSLTLTATDGTSDAYIYSFTGNSVADSSGNILYLQMSLTSVTGASGPVNDPPIPIGTPFNIYYPYWNTNTFDSSNPAPPSWTLYPHDTASVMVFAAEGVFADNAQQVASNLPSGVTDSTKYGVILGALENQIVAAITRGIAAIAGISPENWGNGTAPSQLAPALVAGASTLVPGTTYYYVVTAVNANGETFGSFEFNAIPTASEPCVQVNWQPMNSPASFNVYRGTASQGENLLVASVPNSGTTGSYLDNGSSVRSQQPPAYFPAATPWSAYDAFFHQPAISLNGAAYAGPYDDQGGQSSTISTSTPIAVSITLGPWGSGNGNVKASRKAQQLLADEV